MKRIVVSGYYGLGNTGDEAVLAGTVASFRALDDEAHITVLSASPADTRRQHGIEAVQRYSIRDLLTTIRGADILLSGGGSLLQDVTSARSAAYYFAIILVAEALRKPVMIYAQGIGPINQRTTKLQARLLLNRTSLITVRDEDSAEVLRKLGVVRPPLHVTADPSFALEPSEDEDARRALDEAGVPSDQPLLGVCLRPWKVGDRWAATLSEGLDAAAKRIGAFPVFIPMQHPYDVFPSRDILDRMTVEGSVLDKPMGPSLAKAVVGRMSAVIAMRLHALMFAAAQSTPMVALSYDPKVLAFVRRIPADIPVLDAVSPAPRELANAVEAACGGASAIREAMNVILPEWRKEAVRNARLALGLLCPERNNDPN